MPYICILGPPSSGKSTTSQAVAQRYGICYISVGTELRKAVQANTAAGKRAKGLMDRGQLVSNDIVFDIVYDRMAQPECKAGYVLDGIPRNIEQAKMMDSLDFKMDRVVGLDVPDRVVLQRASHRWVHAASGRTYNTKFNPPKAVGVDDVSGEALVKRADDTEEVLKKRLEQFHNDMEPLWQFYRFHRKFELLDGNRSIGGVRGAAFSLLDRFFTPKNF